GGPVLYDTVSLRVVSPGCPHPTVRRKEHRRMFSEAAACPTLTVPSNPRVLSLARTFVEAVCQARQVDRSTIHAIVLATGEAVTNIVRHAHRDYPEAQFEIQCRIGTDTVEVTLVDQGAPFHLEQVPHLDPGDC